MPTPFFYNSKKILRQQWRLVSKIPKIITYQDICGFQIMIHIILVMEIIVQLNPNSIFFMIDIIPIFILVTWFLNLIHGVSKYSFISITRDTFAA